MAEYKSTAYLLQDNNTEEFFSYFGYNDNIISIPVLFGAKDFSTNEEALAFKNDPKNHEKLSNFSVVKRTSTVTIEKV